VKYLFFLLICLFGAACNTKPGPEPISPELYKIILNDRFAAGDRVVYNNTEHIVIRQKNGVVLIRDRNGDLQSTDYSSLSKINTYFAFRGSEPGVAMQWILAMEPSEPVFHDSLGLSYSYSLDEGKYFQVDYYATEKTGKKTLQSVILEAFISNESDAITLYNEMASRISQNNGNPIGQLGDFSWVNTQKGFLHTLQLTAGRKNILYSLSFADPVNLNQADL
jgi:hypothetical protein